MIRSRGYLSSDLVSVAIDTLPDTSAEGTGEGPGRWHVDGTRYLSLRVGVQFEVPHVSGAVFVGQWVRGSLPLQGAALLIV